MLGYLKRKIDIVAFVFPLMIFIIGLSSIYNAPYLQLDLNITNNKIFLNNYNNAELLSIGDMKVRPTDFTDDQDMIVSGDDFFHFIQFQYYISGYIQKDKDVELQIRSNNIHKIMTIQTTSYPMKRIAQEWILFFAALLCLIISLVLMRKKREDIRITVFIILLSASSSVFLSFAFWSLRSISLDTFSTLFILGINYASFVVFPALFLHFFLIFPKGKAFFIQRKYTYLVYSLPIIVSALYLPRIVYEAEQILFLFAICSGIAMMAYSFFTSSAVERAQIKWVLWGTIIFSFIMLFTYVLPLLGYMSEWYNYQIPAIAFALLPISITFAIEKYRLMDIDSLIDNTLIYTVTLILLLLLDATVLVVLNSFVHEHLSGTFSAFLALWIAITFYSPFRQFASSMIQKVLKRGHYHSHDIALNLAKSIIPLEKIDQIIDAGMKVIKTTLHPRCSEVYFLENKTKKCKDSPIDLSSLMHLRRPEYLFKLPAHVELDKRYHSGIVAPIVNGTLLLGFVFLAEKQSQQLYGKKDIELIEMVTTQMAIGIDGVRTKELAKKDKEKMIQEIHDGIGGIATNISLISQMAKESNDMNYLSQSVSTISELSNDAVFEIRCILQSLDISTSTFQEFIDTLRRYAATMLEPHHILFKLNEENTNPGYIPSAVVTLNIFRIYREALINVIKYAHATAVESFVHVSPEHFTLMIKDNGTGFQDRQEGRGIRHMHQRAKEIEADISLISNNGVEIVLDITLMDIMEER